MKHLVKAAIKKIVMIDSKSLSHRLPWLIIPKVRNTYLVYVNFLHEFHRKT